MSIAWQLFSPWHAVAGGLAIGGAAALYIVGNGRIAGISGIVASPFKALLKGTAWSAERGKLWFLVGLLAAPWLWQLFAPLPASTVSASPLMLVVAGLLVGVGTRLGGGCTSGHGVCGLSRLSARSLANVCCFMGAGFVTVFVMRHVF
jgi:uncharacterized protein